MRKKSILIIAASLLVLFACKKEKADFNYDTVVDSSFRLVVTANGEQLEFPFHDRPTFGTEIYGDSILIKAFLNFRESKDPHVNIFSITISKKFKISELTFAMNNNGEPYSGGDLSNEEFQSIFKQNVYNYSYFDCSQATCNKTEGVELLCESYQGLTLKTEWLNNFMNKSESIEFYQNADFRFTKVEWLSKDALIMEGEFNTDIYSFYGNKIAFRNGYFKAFCNNITYPEVIDKNKLWNK